VGLDSPAGVSQDAGHERHPEMEMKRLAPLAVGLALGAGLAGGEPIAKLLAGRPAMLDLLNNDPIHVSLKGNAASSFGPLARSFEGTNLLGEVDAAYGRLLMPGEKPAFEIHSISSNTFYYISREGKRSDIEEVFRSRTATNELTAVYYATGRRFFGAFRSLIHVTAQDAGEKGVVYAVEVYGYPETGFTRFLIIHLHLQDYFQTHAERITRLIESICKELCRLREPRNGAVAVGN